jgi:hypothetical protein
MQLSYKANVTYYFEGLLSVPHYSSWHSHTYDTAIPMFPYVLLPVLYLVCWRVLFTLGKYFERIQKTIIAAELTGIVLLQNDTAG